MYQIAVPYKTPMASRDALPETSPGAIEKLLAELEKVRRRFRIERDMQINIRKKEIV